MLLQENISSSIKLAYLTIPAGNFGRHYKCLNSAISCGFNLLHALAEKSSIVAYAMPLYHLLKVFSAFPKRKCFLFL